MKDTTKVLVLGFEARLAAGSGVQYGVRFDSAADFLGLPGGTISFEMVDALVVFPADRLDWLIDVLAHIQTEARKLNED